MKIVTIKGLWLLNWCTKFHMFMSYQDLKSWKLDTGAQTRWIMRIWKVENRTQTHKRARAHTSGQQLKITFLDVLDYSEYFDTNVSKFFFHQNSFLFFILKIYCNLNEFVHSASSFRKLCYREKKIRDISVRLLRIV